MGNADRGAHEGVILVLTQADDLTAQLVIDRLEAEGEPVSRLDTSDFPLRSELRTAYSSDRLSARLTLPDGAELDLTTVRSIWNRRPGSFSFPEGLSPDSLRFARAEAQQALVGTLSACGRAWVNHPQRDALARYKPLQLRVAQEAGLRIPDTLISTHPPSVRNFVDHHQGDVIYKRLSPRSLYDERGRVTPYYTTLLDDDLIQRLEQVAITPCLFQENVAKAYELRVTVIGESMIAARVDSQANPATLTDWRYDIEAEWTPYQLSDPMAERLRAVMDRLGLVFGAFDIVVTPDGDYVFLEVNPAGQWAWFCDEITIPIRDAIARLLATGSAHPTAAVRAARL